jgi:hypothetical protein
MSLLSRLYLILTLHTLVFPIYGLIFNQQLIEYMPDHGHVYLGRGAANQVRVYERPTSRYFPRNEPRETMKGLEVLTFGSHDGTIITSAPDLAAGTLSRFGPLLRSEIPVSFQILRNDKLETGVVELIHLGEDNFTLPPKKPPRL